MKVELHNRMNRSGKIGYSAAARHHPGDWTGYLQRRNGTGKKWPGRPQGTEHSGAAGESSGNLISFLPWIDRDRRANWGHRLREFLWVYGLFYFFGLGGFAIARRKRRLGIPDEDIMAHCVNCDTPLNTENGVLASPDWYGSTRFVHYCKECQKPQFVGVWAQ